MAMDYIIDCSPFRSFSFIRRATDARAELLEMLRACFGQMAFLLQYFLTAQPVLSSRIKSSKSPKLI